MKLRSTEAHSADIHSADAYHWMSATGLPQHACHAEASCGDKPATASQSGGAVTMLVVSSDEVRHPSAEAADTSGKDKADTPDARALP